jgi:EAL domain-containing protein (putative c-di-GMP-specific phosphodiesterase class I)/FixJ family two-component response regulator
VRTAVQTAAEPMPTRSVLVIDDDEFVRGVLTRQLAVLGARVATAHDGDSAREALQQQGPFDVVLCDLKMPGVDGVELLRDFALAQGGAALVLMSSCDAKTLAAVEQLAHARDVPLLGCVAKPLGTHTLKALLQRFEAQRAAPAAAPARRSAAEPVTAEELRAAIAAGQIDVYIQPKVDLRSGALAGAEALARWLKPDGTVVMPAAFLGVAERAGLMGALTDLVLRQAFAACGAWQAQGLRTSIAINIPASCLERLDLPERIAAEAGRHGVSPDQVILEITETGVMKDLARSLDVVTRLRLRGFRLAVDDFGMGYSSLERLRHFPFTELKLDRAFVDGAARNAEVRSIAGSSIQLAHSLQLHTCAEGVETEADLEVMRALGCELVQGYFLCRPMPKAQLPGWAARQPEAAVSR